MAGAHDITAIIRSAGERTQDLCYELLCAQVPSENIFIIKEYPFTKALQKTLEIGIESGRRWTLCVDADMLLRTNAVSILLDKAKATGDKVLQVQGNLFDKLLCRPRKAGPHLYRTPQLPKALQYIPAEGLAVRPETFMSEHLASLGFPSVWINQTTGLHDFEQFFRDIYRKAIAHSHKHEKDVQHLLPLWKKFAKGDPDYQVALWGLSEGRKLGGPLPLDVRCFPNSLDAQLHAHGWEEKGALKPSAFTHRDADNLIIEFCSKRVLEHQKV